MPPAQADTSRMLRRHQAPLMAMTSRLARCPQVFGTNENTTKSPTRIRCKSPGLPKLVPAVFMPVMTRFLDSMAIQGKKQAIAVTSAASTARSEDRFIGQKTFIFRGMQNDCEVSEVQSLRATPQPTPSNSPASNSNLQTPFFNPCLPAGPISPAFLVSLVFWSFWSHSLWITPHFPTSPQLV